MAGLTDDIEWTLPGPTDRIPFAGTRRGREAVAQFFVMLNETLVFEQFEAREFLACGDKVVVLGHSRDHMTATGRKIDNEWASVLTMRDGRVARYRIYEDTAAVASALA